ncbi:MAG TPA: vitamin B12 dependent-methionine synthase activation domain-containing protein [Bacillota bacterium]|nr:vitamin B12 dependent-methionine synthase activation domain-containing protein [Bacillota bacterium]
MFEIIDHIEIELTADDILKGQGMDPARASDRVKDVVLEVLTEANSLVEPKAMAGKLPVLDFAHETLTFEGGIFEGPLVKRALAGATEIFLAVCTIGPKLEERMKELMASDMLKGLALDGAGTAAIRLVSQAVTNMLITAAENSGLKTGMKAQPGQEGWPIEQQRVLFSVLPAEKIGVRLTDSCLMIPRKSVSFVLPLGKDLREDATPCDFCSKRERCPWRREKQVAAG